jgi:penicillin-insensitive murein DD-endopeptidase
MKVLPLIFAALLAGCWTAPTPIVPHAGGSTGLPHAGVLTGGAKLAQQGPGFRRFRKDDIRWGNPRLVRAIERAAAAVVAARPDSPPLIVADLSAEPGGQIARHRSHRTGRDADLLFYVVAPDGRPIVNTGFHRFGKDGIAAVDDDRTFVRIDVDRTWLLVKSLVSDDEAQIQWLFVARWLEAMLVEHALARGEADEIVARAQKVLHQPSDSFAHDDHIHARIACTADEAVRGCRGGGHQWPWLEPAPRDPGLGDAALVAALFEDLPPKR